MNAETIAKVLHGRRAGAGWLIPCPAHEDRTPSCTLSEKDGKLLVHCFAGCPQDTVIGALKALDLWPPRAEQKQECKPGKLGPVVAEYIYRDERGAVLFRVTRHEPKTFRQWRPDGAGGWLPGLKDARRVLYRLREVIEAAIVFIVEGEKDCEALRDRGFCATCNAGGAGKWRAEYNEFFRGRTVIVVPDTDEPGRKHARDVIRGVKPVAARVILIDLADDGVKDVSEWFAREHSEVELIGLIDAVWPVEEVTNG